MLGIVNSPGLDTLLPVWPLANSLESLNLSVLVVKKKKKKKGVISNTLFNVVVLRIALIVPL